MMPLPPRARLILADDHQILVEGLRTMLARRFEIVGVAHGGDELLALLGQTSADCLLLDLAMPGRSGLELLPEIREKYPRMKVLIVTMHLERILADAAMRAGASGFVPKDSGSEELSEAIREVLAGGTWVSPRVARADPVEPEGAAGLSALTPRQLEIVRLIGQGKSSAEIGEELGVSVHTITFHRTRIRQTLGIPNEWGLARFALLLQVGTAAPAETKWAPEPVTAAPRLRLV
jgi:two-component system invasion response regulator UvrY